MTIGRSQGNLQQVRESGLGARLPQIGVILLLLGAATAEAEPWTVPLVYLL